MGVLTITDRAAARIQDIMSARTSPAAGVRLGTREAGCSGLMYTLDYVDEPRPGDELVEDKGIRLYVDAASLLYLLGSEMDFVEDKFSSRFVFSNPNESARCGCGESFSI